MNSLFVLKAFLMVCLHSLGSSLYAFAGSVCQTPTLPLPPSVKCRARILGPGLHLHSHSKWPHLCLGDVGSFVPCSSILFLNRKLCLETWLGSVLACLTGILHGENSESFLDPGWRAAKDPRVADWAWDSLFCHMLECPSMGQRHKEEKDGTWEVSENTPG